MDELQQMKYKYGTAKILVFVLLVGLILIGGLAMKEEMKYNQQMKRCNQIISECDKEIEIIGFTGDYSIEDVVDILEKQLENGTKNRED